MDVTVVGVVVVVVFVVVDVAVVVLAAAVAALDLITAFLVLVEATIMLECGEKVEQVPAHVMMIVDGSKQKKKKQPTSYVSRRLLAGFFAGLLAGLPACLLRLVWFVFQVYYDVLFNQTNGSSFFDEDTILVLGSLLLCLVCLSEQEQGRTPRSCLLFARFGWREDVADGRSIDLRG